MYITCITVTDSSALVFSKSRYGPLCLIFSLSLESECKILCFIEFHYSILAVIQGPFQRLRMSVCVGGDVCSGKVGKQKNLSILKWSRLGMCMHLLLNMIRAEKDSEEN